MPARENKTEPLVVQERRLFQKQLLSWYAVFRRRLPWRRAPSLYKTVVSEFMLQQTQVETVLPYFERWMKAFPDFKSLAAASEEQVLKCWEGLGYYSRARNLHRLARQIVRLKKIPKDKQSWLAFPGVGPYTASAITSISFGAPEAVVDGNVIRVISRLVAEPALFKDNADAVKRLKPVADILLSQEVPGDYNQAVMELGATLCVRSKPRCLFCPVSKLCAAYTQANPETYPRFQKKKTEQVQVDRIWAIRNGSLLLARSPKTSRRLSEIYELPHRKLLGRQARDTALIAVKRRAISNQQIEERIFLLNSTLDRAKLSQDGLLDWVPIGRLDGIILSGPHRRWITELLNKT